LPKIAEIELLNFTAEYAEIAEEGTGIGLVFLLLLSLVSAASAFSAVQIPLREQE
jgi:hypothetical protein